MTYQPIKITGFETGLVQEREEFMLVEDGFPILENAYVWREAVRKKNGGRLLARLRRVFTDEAMTNISGSPYTENVLTQISAETNASLECEGFEITFDPAGTPTVLEDLTGTGALTLQGGSSDPWSFSSGTVNYATGAVSVTFGSYPGGTFSVTASFGYYPRLPAMGALTRELNGLNAEDSIVFDTKYAYNLVSGKYQEFISGTTWTGSNSQFFYGTNWWVDGSNNKLFWVTNFNQSDPIRYTNGTTWTNFEPLITATDTLYQARFLKPFRGRMIAFNTIEGVTASGRGSATQNPQRIRWSQIGTPLSADSWRQDIRGKGAFLDIPTSEQITAVGFIYDDIVVFCERSTWQLRYTGRKIQPFQIEKVNTELGTASPGCVIQFDKEIAAIGDVRIIKTDTFSAIPIDIKIPDFALRVENSNFGRLRVQGIRDRQQQLAYWMYPDSDSGEYQGTFPTKRLVYNYENDSWAIFRDNYTVLGRFWPSSDLTWNDVGNYSWDELNITWRGLQDGQPVLIGGNHHGYVLQLDELNADDVSLQISDITGRTPNATRLSIPDHNLETGEHIVIEGIPSGTPFASLNDTVFEVVAQDADTLDLFVYDSTTDEFSEPQQDDDATYIGCGSVRIVPEPRIRSKKFANLDQGRQIQIGMIDTLWTAADAGKVGVKFYTNYNDDRDANVNDSDSGFFNQEVEIQLIDNEQGSRVFRRIAEPVFGNFAQVEFGYTNGQLNDGLADKELELHAMILWQRAGARTTQG